MKLIKNLDFLQKLSLAARWFLPYPESVELIEDYRGLLSEMEGAAEAEPRFGDPVRLVREQADVGKVRHWYLVLGFLAFSMVLSVIENLAYPALWYSHSIISPEAIFICGIVFFAGLNIIFMGSYSKPMRIFLAAWLCLFVFLLNKLPLYDFMWTITDKLPLDVFDIYYRTKHYYRFDSYFIQTITLLISLIYFGFRKKRRPGHFPKLILAVSAGVIAVQLAAWGIVYYSYQVNVYPLAYHLDLARGCCLLACVFFMLLAVASLILARMYDRRWRAVFILSFVCAVVFSAFILEWTDYGYDTVTQQDFLIGNFYNDLFRDVDPKDAMLFGHNFFEFEFRDLAEFSLNSLLLAAIGLI